MRSPPCTIPSRSGYREQEDFINAVAAVETELLPASCLTACLSIEDKHGTETDRALGAAHDRPRYPALRRPGRVDEPDLVIPHPLMATRKFVLAPLAEIAPDVSASGPRKRPFGSFLRELKDTATVVQVQTGSDIAMSRKPDMHRIPGIS